MRRSLATLDAAGSAPVSRDDEAPFLVAGLGWRSGSTLLQRVLMTDPGCLIWGEPIDARMFVNRLAEALSNPDLPPEAWIGDRPTEDLARQWVTFLWPDPADLRAGLRALFDVWLAQPARRRGFSNWGLKEVRWSGVDLLLLRWLYPRSHVLLIIRDPVEAYDSLVRYGLHQAPRGFWARWPDRPVVDARDYAVFWNSLAETWALVLQTQSVEVVRYKDLANGAYDLAALAERIGLTLSPDVALSRRINGPRLRGQGASPDELKIVLDLTAQYREPLGL